MTNSEKIIEVRNLKKKFPVRSGNLQKITDWVHAVDDVSFSIQQGSTLGLVGESGCGKTTIGRLMLNLIKPDEGSVSYQGKNIFQIGSSDLKEMRRNMQIIFQDPFLPLWTHVDE